MAGSMPGKHPTSNGSPVPTTSSDKSNRHKRQATISIEERVPYESPLKRVRKAVMHEKRTIDTVDDLKVFVRSNNSDRGVSPVIAASVALRMRVAWTSFHVCQTGPVARIHVVDRQADDTVEEMHEDLRDQPPENKQVVDSETATISVYGLDETSKGIPPDGAIIYVRNVRTLKLFGGYACQMTATLDGIKVE